ncbi:ATP-binding protein [Desulfuromonas sp. AOP6]|uniref:two-component system histidine kinase PnpS n=1 Tax=Desulfuromonas sp. AOP6 TaxID=1566351 RepID=UPI00126BF54C|nr:ATP-binding protein [Desulfuromonas sp. AOP6]BCA80801.1 PAS domain-containing sensor histidine kinase [Desulfuromonas sp. AOP6]
MMRPKRLLWQFYIPCLLIILLSLLVLTWYFSNTLRSSYLKQTKEDLMARARLVTVQVKGLFAVSQSPYLETLVAELGQDSATRITLIMPSGVVLADSDEEAARMENHAGRPEVVEAMQGSTGRSVRFSHTIQQDMMYVALPVAENGAITGVVRTAMAITALDETLDTLLRRVILGGVVAAVLAALLSLLVSRRISQPLEMMKQGAERFSRGELQQPLVVRGSAEVRSLAEAMNKMAAQLDERIRTVLRQRNEQEAVLASMVEGVLAVDAEERILRLNRAAEKLLTLDSAEVQGRRIQEVVRKADLQRFIAQALSSPEAVEGDIVFHGDPERFLQAHGTALRGSQGQRIGVLIVLNDVTRLRRLETMRRDFVANVSHELKTPITAIKGFVETLLDGAINQPEDAQRFLSIICKQADRLNAIIDDLLDLSRIEQGAERHQIDLQPGAVDEVVRAAIQSCEMQAQEREILVEQAVDESLRARFNPPLIEQALVNLISNAIKYSSEGSRVLVEGRQSADGVVIRVIDQGCGIAREHLPRLFERFYRVDKARSRKQGGTGLGLAIVKHIVQTHGGRVAVESVPGKGSTFSIILPSDLRS